MHQCSSSYPRRIKTFNFDNFENLHIVSYDQNFSSISFVKIDSMSGCDFRLVFTFPSKDSTLQYKKCVHLWNNFPCISTLLYCMYEIVSPIITCEPLDNIITYSPYSPYYVTRTSANDSALSLSRHIDGNSVTSILHCHWLKFWWRNTDYMD